MFIRRRIPWLSGGAGLRECIRGGRQAIPVTVAAGLILAALAACASSHVLVGRARPAISPGLVQLYLTAPPKYEEVALLETSSRASWALTAQARTDKVIERLRKEAASVGANGILLQGIGEQGAGSVGLASSTANISGRTASAVGVGGAVYTYQKIGGGIAIYVPPDALLDR